VDPSTGLPNHLELMTRLERSIQRAASPRTHRFALVGLDLEGIGGIQDRFGLAAVDMLVAATARRVRQTLRPSDMVARIGEERLAILLDHFPDDEPLSRLVERIEQSVDGPFLIGGERLGLTAIHATSPTISVDASPTSAGEILDALDRAVSRARTMS
jgi:diguanylate cyclase (GGDEF)-like protein